YGRSSRPGTGPEPGRPARPEAVTQVVDHHDYFVRGRPSSAAKSAEAALRMSLARLSSFLLAQPLELLALSRGELLGASVGVGLSLADQVRRASR
ncbi:hypothetical protein ACN3XK_60290, partial [Actinomadura welshii]